MWHLPAAGKGPTPPHTLRQHDTDWYYEELGQQVINNSLGRPHAISFKLHSNYERMIRVRFNDKQEEIISNLNRIEYQLNKGGLEEYRQKH